MSEQRTRTDWALLVPPQLQLPVHEVLVVGGTDEMAQDLVDVGLAGRWRRPSAPADRSLMTVAWADWTGTLEQLAAYTAPGGVMIIELDRRGWRRSSLSLAAARRRLRQVGSSVSSAHFVRPSFERPTRYLPIDDPPAVRWYLDTLFIASTPGMRLAMTLAKAVTSSSIATRAIDVVATRAILIANVGSDHVGSDHVGSDHVGCELPAPSQKCFIRPGERAIVLTSGFDAASRSVALPFAPKAASPNAVVKVASTPATTAGTLGEHQRLTALHALLPAGLARSVPVPLLQTTSINRTVCVQSCAEGRNMSASAGLWGRPRRRKWNDLELVVDWLAHFGVATRKVTVDAQATWMDIFDQVDSCLMVSAGGTSFLGRARDTALRTGLAAVAVQQHYDTVPSNIHIAGRRPFFLDWETDHFRPDDSLGPPLADILYLVTYWYFQIRGVTTLDDEPAAVVRLFADPVPGDPDVVAARRTIDRALSASGLQRVCVPAVLGALWAERACYKQRRTASLGSPLTPAQNGPAVYLEALGGAPEHVWGEHGWWSLPVLKESSGRIRRIRGIRRIRRIHRDGGWSPGVALTDQNPVGR